MSNDVSKLSDAVGTGKTPADFPIGSLRNSLLPAQLTQVKIFQAHSCDELESLIATWVQETQSIIAVPGPLTMVEDCVVISVTYVPAHV